MTLFVYTRTSPLGTILFFLLIISVTGCTKPAEEKALKFLPGEKLPDLQVVDLKNKPAILQTATGKTLILNLWATWCAPCRQEMPSLDRLSNLLDETQYDVVGLAVDQDDHLVREFLLDRKIYFQNYLDSNSENSQKIIGIRVFPSTLIIAPDGTLLKVVEGARHWDSLQTINEIKALAQAR